MLEGCVFLFLGFKDGSPLTFGIPSACPALKVLETKEKREHKRSEWE